MSVCISREGEYGSHDVANDGTRDGFWCRRCFMLDADALITEVERLRGAVAQVEYDADRAARKGYDLDPHDVLDAINQATEETR